MELSGTQFANKPGRCQARPVCGGGRTETCRQARLKRSANELAGRRAPVRHSARSERQSLESRAPENRRRNRCVDPDP